MGVGAQRSRPSEESRGGTVAESLSRRVLGRVDSLADRLVLTIRPSTCRDSDSATVPPRDSPDGRDRCAPTPMHA